MKQTEEKQKVYATNYDVAVHWCNNHYILCNNIPEIDPSVYENMMPVLDVSTGEPEEYEESCYTEIFQWFLSDCSEGDVKYLRENFGLLFTYSDVLNLYVLCVTHYGTSWDYVDWETSNENAKRKLGQKK